MYLGEDMWLYKMSGQCHSGLQEVLWRKSAPLRSLGVLAPLGIPRVTLPSPPMGKTSVWKSVHPGSSLAAELLVWASSEI